MRDLIVVGGGPAGLTAAIYAARAGLSVAVAERGFAGGQMTATADIVNYPGFEMIDGAELARRMEAHARGLGAEMLTGEVRALRLDPGALTVVTGSEIPARALILAMGTQRRKLAIPGEERLTGRGVSFCAVCDGAFFKDQDVAVVGGGDTALEDAAYLAGVCRQVTLVHRRDAFRGGRRLEAALRRLPNVTFRLEHTAEEILGDKSVQALRVRGVKTRAEETLPVSAVFVAVGVEPDTALLRGALPLDAEGRVEAPEGGHTPIPGVFVAGDLRQKPIYQIITACADGATAATSVSRFLRERE
ncbi:MAG: FAD-dependent oxidoreductase [Oscillospiraceae bacterium]|nr:FAD-dependent oxidoreductase [Oscillospiraceae bacterium]